MRNMVGNEVNHLGIVLLESDYSRRSGFRSFMRSVVEGVLFVFALLSLMAFFVALSIAING